MKISSIAWNLAGLGAPLAAALLAVPPLLGLLGKEGFGLLSLVWALTALSGLFDLGVGRATTRAIADLVGRRHADAIPATLKVALRLTLASGMVGAGVVLCILLLDLREVLHLQSTPVAAVTRAIWILALCVPVQALIATYRGSCEGLQEFRSISLVRMVTGCANFLAPWAVATQHPDIDLLAASLLVTRLLALAAFRAVARSHIPSSTAAAPAVGNVGSELLRSGSWLSVSAIVSPLLVQADRFAIAAVLSASAVTAYALPFDIVTQLLVVVSAVSAVAFPSIASAIHRDSAQAELMFNRWLLRVALGMAVICASLALALPAALTLWVGERLPPESATIGRLLCLGVWINSIGSMYYSWLHAHGRFRHTAVLHLAELPVYAGALLLLLGWLGVTGAALAWLARVTIDTLGLFLLSRAPAAQAPNKLAQTPGH